MRSLKMLISWTILITFVLNSMGLTEKGYSYDEKEILVPLDHFSFANNETFKLRYLINNQLTNEVSPIFFYTGNEGNIELFAQNTGFMWELSKVFNATVVFAEHRYYGKSLPFAKDTFNSTRHYGFLNAEQALADYAQLVALLKGDRNVPVIAFGGSYGGMLAAWFRMRYPYLVHGSLAASAPIWQFDKLTPCDIYAKIVTSVFKSSYSSNCTLNIKRSWDIIKNYSSTENGRTQLQNVFKFCKPVVSTEDVNELFEYLEDVYGNLAMANYPYKNDFIVPLPAYPVRQFCYYLRDFQKQDKDLLNAMQLALSVYTNFSGNSVCLNYTSAYDPALGGEAWDIQTCNEMVMPMCSTEETMFVIKDWNFNDYSEKCFKKFRTRPLLDEILIRYGGKSLEWVSNIIFSNGLLDPWSGGGVLHTTNTKIFVIIMPEAAHHLDLRSANINDPKSVIEARKEETKIIGEWISQFK